ncbi:hypothetical protein J6590_099623 [Homalodisca vitripennis]|nr:hypothetical protein J6590_099623 [Homalodisca vitripennis]
MPVYFILGWFPLPRSLPCLPTQLMVWRVAYKQLMFSATLPVLSPAASKQIEWYTTNYNNGTRSGPEKPSRNPGLRSESAGAGNGQELTPPIWQAL